MSLIVFDTYIGAQSMEIIYELWHYLAPLLPSCGPSHVLVVIVIDKLILILDCIYKRIPSGINPIYSKLLYGTSLPISFPPMFEMRESLKVCECDLFPIGKIVNREITFYHI
jgi:hypothetical protein